MSDDNVIDLDAAREASQPNSQEMTCAKCGHPWFDTAVIINKETERVTGYAVTGMTCAACGEPV